MLIFRLVYPSRYRGEVRSLEWMLDLLAVDARTAGAFALPEPESPTSGLPDLD